MKKLNNTHRDFGNLHKRLGYKIPELSQTLIAFENDIENCLHTDLTPEKNNEYFAALKTRRENLLWKEDRYNTHNKDNYDYTTIVDAAIKARNALVKYHIRLIYYIAKHFQGLGLDIGDLITIGSEGALKAAEKHDGGETFTSYMNYYIQGHIMNAIAAQKKYNENIKSMDDSRGVYDNDTNPSAGREDGKSFVIDGSQIISSGEDLSDHGLFLEDRTTDIYRAISTLRSQNRKVLCLCFDIPLKDSLSPRQEEILKYYREQYGSKELSLEKIGQIFNFTPQRIYYIKQKSIRLLRHSSRSDLLKEYNI